MMNIDELLRKAKEIGASDLILKVPASPLFRVNGKLNKSEHPALTQEVIVELAKKVVSEKDWADFERNLELDIAYKVEGIARFRVNLFKQRGSLCMVFRLIPDKIPTIAELGLPEMCGFLAMRPRGLVLVTGPAGCGKSTTQAALIDHRNSKEECHIMTVEDPIEFVHFDKRGIVNQRQVGRDTLSFANGLKYVLRQDPDIILIGEMRDLETISLAITAAETGHLALGTLHTSGAAQTVDRVVNAFPVHQQQQIRMQLSINLVGVVSQLLLETKDGKGLVAAYEIMLATPAIRNTIREGKTFMIPQMIQIGSERGMLSMERSISNLVSQGKVDIEEAIRKTPNPDELENIMPTGTGSMNQTVQA